MRPRVFISHSGDSGFVKDLLDLLLEELDAGGFQPLIDRQTMAGRNFHTAIDDYIRTCDAALFVISPRALKREHPWVRDEANQLRQRITGTEAFQGIPVLVDGVRELDKSWDATGLRLQNPIVDDDPESVVRKVVRELEPTRARLRAQSVARALAGQLRRVEYEDLRDASQPLGDHIPQPLELHVALRLLRATPETIVAVASRLASADEKAAQAVLNVALPFTWVDRQAARSLDAAVRSLWRPAALNARRPFTTRCYAICGSGEHPPWEVRPLRSLAGELLQQLPSDATRARAWSDGALDEPPARARRPLIYAVDCPRLDADIVAQLDAIAGNARDGIVFLAHRTRWASVPAPIARRIALVTPELDPARERSAYVTYTDGLTAVQEARDAYDSYMTRPLT